MNRRRDAATSALGIAIGAATTVLGMAIGMWLMTIVGSSLPQALGIGIYILFMLVMFLGGAAGMGLGYLIAYRLRR